METPQINTPQKTSFWDYLRKPHGIRRFYFYVGVVIGLLLPILFVFSSINSCGSSFSNENGPGVHFSYKFMGIAGGVCELVASQKYADFINEKAGKEILRKGVMEGSFVKIERNYVTLGAFMLRILYIVLPSILIFSVIGALVDAYKKNKFLKHHDIKT